MDTKTWWTRAEKPFALIFGLFHRKKHHSNVQVNFNGFGWTENVFHTQQYLEIFWKFPEKNEEKQRRNKAIPYLRRLNRVNRNGRPAMEAAQNLFAAIIQRKQPSLRCMKFTEKKKIGNGNENKIRKALKLINMANSFCPHFESTEPKLSEKTL